MKIITVLARQSLEEVKNVANNSQAADIFELRIDVLEKIDINELRLFKQQLTKPVIFTIRALQDGGKYKYNETKRVEQLIELAVLKPEYIDIENYVANTVLEKIKSEAPEIKIIRSFHNVNYTPENLEQIFKNMQHPLCDVYKLVTYAQSALDSLKILQFIKKHAQKHKLVAHAMGERGKFSRIAGGALGNHYCYTKVDFKNNVKENSNKLISGIVSLNEAMNIYDVKKINRNTKIYSLIGFPIENSLGHIYHNNYFKLNNKNSVYVKIPLEQNELNEFFQQIKVLPFYGFSITMPLKQAVMPFILCDKLVKKIGTVNTIKIQDHKLYSTNTDGLGALNSIENKVKVNDKRLLILGAGGAAKAIIDEANKRGAHITIVNRTEGHAVELAQQYNGNAFTFINIKECSEIFDVIINSLSFTAKLSKECLQAIKKMCNSNTIFMDINYIKPNKALQAMAKEQNMSIVAGVDMFNEQASLQQKFFRKCSTL